MASAPASKGPPTKPKKDREKERERKEKQAQVSERLKTVVRRLPANLPEDVFWQSVNQWVSDETVTWKAFFPGNLKKRYF
jgi:regulator of nonsense transcripts 3